MTRDLISIGGYDPSGSAGVLLDIRVFERLGQRGFGVLTAVTAQNPERVDRVFPVTARALAGQFERLAESLVVAGIKVGMLATSANLRAAAGVLERQACVPRVIDPVLRSSSGALLLEKRAWPLFLEAFEGRAELVTPNLDEAEALTRRTVRSVAAMKLARNVRGTGCFLASSILAYLADGRPLKEACGLGISRVGRAMRAAVPAGQETWVFDLNRERGRVPLPPVA